MTDGTLLSVPGDAPAVERGVGFFETVLVAGRRAVLWNEHASRLLSTLSAWELPAPSEDDLRRAAAGAFERFPGSGERGLRLSWIAVGADLERRESWRLDVSLRPIPDSTLARRDGSRCVSLPPALRRDSPGMKSTSYAAAILGLRFARRAGGHEGLFTHVDGSYLEGTGTALAAWGRGRPFRAPAPTLPSVTAQAFLTGEDRRATIRSADLRAGSLLLGSLTKASALMSLDGEACDVPPALEAAVAAFNQRLLSDPALGVTL